MKTCNEAKAIADAMRSWLCDHLPATLGRSKCTVDNYRRTMDLYVRYLEERRGVNITNLGAASFDVDAIEGWMVWLKEVRACSSRTCNNRLAGLRSFLKHLSKRDSRFSATYVKSLDVGQLRYTKDKPESLTKEAIKAIMAAPDLSTRKGRRDLTIISITFSEGARIGEVLGLRMNQLHLDHDKPYVTLRGKGGKSRPAYLLPKVKKLLDGYIREFHGRTWKPDDLLFFSDYGGSRHALSQDSVWKSLKEYAATAHERCKSVPLNLHAHDLRHARAGLWLEEGLNIVEIKELLGHENLNTTMIYVGISKEQMYDALKNIEGDEITQMPKKWKRKDGQVLHEFLGLK